MVGRVWFFAALVAAVLIWWFFSRALLLLVLRLKAAVTIHQQDGHVVGHEVRCDDVGEIDATVEGDESKIAFNGKYLTDVLSVLHESQVALEITNPSSPGMIRPVGADNYTHVIMPMFIQW